uniref:Uncharacterized protein n=1 Tax=Aureoumbra lagunensis TaxID=44058 RepID=A0A7S3JQB1_9STRA
MDEIVALLNDNRIPSEPPRVSKEDETRSEISLGLRVGTDGRLVDSFLEAHERQTNTCSSELLCTDNGVHIEEVSNAVEDEELFSNHPPPRQNDGRSQLFHLERKNEELRLRVAGLSKTIRELSEAKAKLTFELEERDEEIKKCRTRLAAMATTRGLSKGGSPIILHHPTSSTTDKKRVDTLTEALNEARRRERRAVELGSSLRRRLSEERERADAAEQTVTELRELLATAETEAARQRSNLKRAVSATQRAKQHAANLELNANKFRALNANLERDLDLASKNFAIKKRQLEQAKLDALTHADHQSKRAAAAREECLALRAKCKSLSSNNNIVARAKTKTKHQQTTTSTISKVEDCQQQQQKQPSIEMHETRQQQIDSTALLRPSRRQPTIWDSDSDESSSPSPTLPWRRISRYQEKPPRIQGDEGAIAAGTRTNVEASVLIREGLDTQGGAPSARKNDDAPVLRKVDTTSSTAARVERLRERFRRVVAVEPAIAAGLPE